ncbi:MAG: acyltransferase family protein, partial [Pseudohongiellaceae bacterium]
DAVRAFALLAGVVLHATMSFFLPIPAMDVSQSTSLGVLFYVIHIFRMSLFFMIAGFFAHKVFHRRGMRDFVRDRVKRIAIPMVVGWLVISPLLGIIVIWGLIRTFGAEAAEGTEAPAMGLPLTHLWFLYYLCIFYVGFLALRTVFSKLTGGAKVLHNAADRIVSLVSSSVLGPALIGLPLALVFYTSPAWPAWFGLPTPDYGLTPQLPAVVGYGVAFALGWMLDRQGQLLDIVRRNGLINLVVALILTVACLALVGLVPGTTDPFIERPAWQRTVYILCYTSAMWYWTFGIIGAALRFLSQPSPTWRYLADASYWIYLAHLPLVFFLQVVVAKL